jgi:hypothetical protein
MTPMIHHDAMNDMLQVVIPAALTILVAYQGTLSNTGRLRRNIKVDVDLLTALDNLSGPRAPAYWSACSGSPSTPAASSTPPKPSHAAP